MSTVIAVVSDLIFSTKITSTASAVGAAVKVARSLERLDEHLAAGASLVLIDLDSDGVDPIAAIGQCKRASPPPRVVGFVSHVNAARIAESRDAGADQVLARSAFVSKLPGLLAEFASGGNNAQDPGQEN